MIRRAPAAVVFAGLFAGVCAALVPASALAGSGAVATATGEASASVLQPLTVTRVSDLDFGAVFAARQVAGTVTVGPDSAVAYGGGAGAACVSGACARPHASRFAVTGEPDRAYTISAPARLTATGTAPGGSAPGQPESLPPLLIESIAVRTASRPGAGANGLLDSAGNDFFDVGGRLLVPAGAPSGHYRADLPVVVSYG